MTVQARDLPSLSSPVSSRNLERGQLMACVHSQHSPGLPGLEQAVVHVHASKYDAPAEVIDGRVSRVVGVADVLDGSETATSAWSATSDAYDT